MMQMSVYVGGFNFDVDAWEDVYFARATFQSSLELAIEFIFDGRRYAHLRFAWFSWFGFGHVFGWVLSKLKVNRQAQIVVSYLRSEFKVNLFSKKMYEEEKKLVYT